MANTGAIIVVGAIIAGVAVGGGLFLFYPDLMFGNTSFSSQSDGSGGSAAIGGVEDTTTANMESDFGGGSSSNNTASNSSSTGAYGAP